jgi:FtsZ-binding cell division protein ZapB
MKNEFKITIVGNKINFENAIFYNIYEYLETKERFLLSMVDKRLNSIFDLSGKLVYSNAENCIKKIIEVDDIKNEIDILINLVIRIKTDINKEIKTKIKSLGILGFVQTISKDKIQNEQILDLQLQFKNEKNQKIHQLVSGFKKFMKKFQILDMNIKKYNKSIRSFRIIVDKESIDSGSYINGASEYSEIFKSKLYEDLISVDSVGSNSSKNRRMGEVVNLVNKQEKAIDFLKKDNSQIKKENSQIKEENSQIKEENSQIKEENSQIKEDLRLIKAFLKLN